jgi:hypothetical protein
MKAAPKASRVARGYGPAHQKRRELLAPFVAAGSVRCARCGELIRPGEPWDLGHLDGDRRRYSGPEHRACNRSTASRLWEPALPEPEPERDGLPASDERWRVPWLKGFRRVPRDATWPRLMTVPHPRAVGSLGPDFIRWAERREGKPLRWWQRLVATRLLEVDAHGRLVWETLVLSMARQLGKSWLLRELILWRIHQGERFGEPQDIVHTGKDLQVCQEIQLKARWWAKERPGSYKVREVNGQESIQNLADGSRWMLRAKESAYGLSVSVAAVDEAWKVKPETLNESLIPTMVEREQPQLWLISTAHRLATVLMLRRRRIALEELEAGDGDLLIEWSAPTSADLDSVEAWRLASPFWTPQRERLIGKQLEAMRAGEVDPDAEEPDPEASFRTQWLNQWPRTRTEPPGNTEPLLPGGLWLGLTEPELASEGALFVALEDDYGRGAAVAAVCRLEDGRLEVDGWECEDWDSAIRDVERLQNWRQIRELHVGASLLDRLPVNGTLPRVRPALSKQTSLGLSLFRDLAAGRQLVHDQTTSELDQALAQTQVRESPSGLQIARGPRHLVKAVVWAVSAAHKPARMPAIR